VRTRTGAADSSNVCEPSALTKVVELPLFSEETATRCPYFAAIAAASSVVGADDASDTRGVPGCGAPEGIGGSPGPGTGAACADGPTPVVRASAAITAIAQANAELLPRRVTPTPRYSAVRHPTRGMSRRL
jgi:hypothetical protein